MIHCRIQPLAEREWQPPSSSYHQRYEGDAEERSRKQQGFIEHPDNQPRFWFGDEEAERRRMLDERYDRQRYNQRTDPDGEVRVCEVTQSQS